MIMTHFNLKSVSVTLDLMLKHVLLTNVRTGITCMNPRSNKHQKTPLCIVLRTSHETLALIHAQRHGLRTPKSKISEKLVQCGRQNMLWPYLKIWDWDWIFGRAVKAISSLGIRSPWPAQWMFPYHKSMLVQTIRLTHLCLYAETCAINYCQKIITFLSPDQTNIKQHHSVLHSAHAMKHLLWSKLMPCYTTVSIWCLVTIFP